MIYGISVIVIQIFTSIKGSIKGRYIILVKTIYTDQNSYDDKNIYIHVHILLVLFCTKQ